jgi:flagellar assembly protein FliH
MKSTVIKLNDQNPRMITRLETVNVADHLSEAKVVLRKSREQAREILRQAQVEAGEAFEIARAKGFEAGFRKGYETGQKSGHDGAFEEAKKEFAERQSALVSMFNETVQQFDAQKRDLFIQASGDLLEFAMHVARRVTKRIGAIDREAATENLHAALRLVESATDLTVYVNPADAESIKDFAKSAGSVLERAAHFRIEVDKKLAPGGCRLATPMTEVDATVDTQLDQIEALVTAQSSEI